MAATSPTATNLPFVHVLALTCIVIMAPATSLPSALGAGTAPVNCAQVVSSIAPCIPYLTNNPGAALFTPACCSGIRILNGAALSTAGRQSICRCLKSAAESVPWIDYNLASRLPTICGINAAYTISPSIDCISVK